MSEVAQNSPVAEQQRMKGGELMKKAQQKLQEAQEDCCESGKIEEACDLYAKAGIAFKIAKEWDVAGQVFSEVAGLQLVNGRKIDAGINYMEAAKCYRKVSLDNCEQCLLKAAEVYSDVGRSEAVAKQLMALAELNEEQGNLEKALKQYQSAADMFTEEDIVAKTTQCLLGVATNSALLGDFERAEQIFEELGEQSLSNKLLKYTACEKYTRAGLCRLARNPQDGDGMLQKLAEWKEICPSFAESRECAWLTKMARACQKEDIDEFNEATRIYELTRLPKWEEDLVKNIRKRIQGSDLR